jgi:hypothetical protein
MYRYIFLLLWMHFYFIQKDEDWPKKWTFQIKRIDSFVSLSSIRSEGIKVDSLCNVSLHMLKMYTLYYLA